MGQCRGIKIVWMLLCVLPTLALGADLTLWYDKPANAKNPAVNEGLPVGNGRLGGLVLGGTVQERIALNEDSLWTGTDNPSGEDKTMGDYQALGNLYLNLNPGTQVSPDNYRRSLNLSTGIAQSDFTLGDARITRETFASAPAQTLITRWSASKPGSVSGTVELAGMHQEKTTVDGLTLSFKGQFSNGIQYEAAARIITKGGKVQANDGKIVLEKMR